MDPRNPLLAPGQLINGFLVEKGNDLPNLRAHCWELRHQATGARHLHISHELDEKVFITCLRTLPQDDTGVPHILEHTVLEGSRQYPVKMFTELPMTRTGTIC
jgi:Zn-dependent M16 (insulinase) family peptidase